MRIRKIALFGTLFLFLGCLGLYLLLDITLPLENRNVITSQEYYSPDSSQKERWNLDVGFLFNQNASSYLKAEVVGVPQLQNVVCDKISNDRAASEVDIQMLSVYKELKFDNLDGGVWKQGWNVMYNANQWGAHNKLKVFVVPHSHNDPGWRKTVEDYYQSQTRSILNNMVTKLLEDERRKFIWAEISFFSLWWQEISEETKLKVKLLLARKQLEIVTGGWVMNDEANSHYYSILQQLTHGHQWMREHLNIIPRFGWAIDPFGHSPVMPYILKEMGLEALLIQRTHYSVKKYLARNKQLEFRWRQLWDVMGKTDFLSHMMPFYSYDIPHTCGPDPKICCQFDFKRLPGYGVTCPWGVPPQLITDSNLAHRAELLLDQYRKKSQLYNTNVVLVPLGDDFRYGHSSEWDAQYTNYQKLFNYMNNNPSLHVEAQFGTLSDYFEAVKAEKSVDQFPSLSGDFFTYADREDHYWSGYFTSRPFYKRMDRELQAYLRSADILFTIGWLEVMKTLQKEWLTDKEAKLTQLLQDARSSLSLFQHHDGVTGTAKDHVVQDYAKKLFTAIHGCQHVIQQVAHYLLSPSKEDYEPAPDFTFFNLDDIRKMPSSIPEQSILTFGSGLDSHRVVFYNSLTWSRTEVVSLRVGSADVQVKNSHGNVVKAQVSPLCQLVDIYVKCYQLSFVVEVEPLSLTTYFVEEVSPDDQNRAVRSQVRVLNSAWKHTQREFFEDWVKDFGSDKEFSIQNKKVSATFSTNGLLKAVTLKHSGQTFPLHLSFIKYTARQGKERSGAYLFLPDGEGETLRHHLPLTLVFEGPVMSKVVVQLPNILHSVILYNSPGPDGIGLEIHNLVNITAVNSNYELSMRLSSNINNDDTFYTDLNGMQMIQRKTFNKLPLQANFYPMPTAVFIEDGSVRLSVASAQPLGVASLKEGQIEVMQDRRLLQDDNRGLDQGVMDNKPTLTMFRLFVEQRKESCPLEPEEGYMSAAVYLSLNSLNYPIHHLVWSGDPRVELETKYSAVTAEQGVDIHLVSLSTIMYPNVAAGAVLHRVNTDVCFVTDTDYQLSNNGQVNLSSFLPTTPSDSFFTASLSFLRTGPPQKILQPQTLCPMAVQAFLIPKQIH